MNLTPVTPPWRESMRTNEIMKQALALAALTILSLFPIKLAMAESDSSPLVAQLTRTYKLASPAIETDGSATFVGGTILLVQRPGVVGYNYANIALEEICPARLEEGQLTPPRSVVCTVPARQSRKAFPVADPVCVTAFRLSEATDQLSIHLIECGAGARIRTDRTFYALLEIQLPKGSVKATSLGTVQSEIAKVLAPTGAAGASKPSGEEEAKAATEATPGPMPPPLAPLPATSTASQPAPSPATSPAASPEPQRLPPPLPPLRSSGAGNAEPPATPGPVADAPAATASAATVAIGQTIDQVVAILGTPSIVGDAGVKLIYIYSQRFKVVFLKGKVSEINQLDNLQ